MCLLSGSAPPARRSPGSLTPFSPGGSERETLAVGGFYVTFSGLHVLHSLKADFELDKLKVCLFGQMCAATYMLICVRELFCDVMKLSCK